MLTGTMKEAPMKKLKHTLVFLAVGWLVPLHASTAGDDPVKRGRYIVEITGCNDCHTPGYTENGGQLPVEKWLTGNPVGFQGPWGITFPVNLRLLLQCMTEEEWVAKSRTLVTRPPMPWFNVRFMTEQDQRAVYQFVKSLGPAGNPAPDYVPPGKPTDKQFIPFVPVSSGGK
jgi:mono/diheme cytochrome c family protein